MKQKIIDWLVHWIAVRVFYWPFFDIAYKRKLSIENIREVNQQVAHLLILVLVNRNVDDTSKLNQLLDIIDQQCLVTCRQKLSSDTYYQLLFKEVFSVEYIDSVLHNMQYTTSTTEIYNQCNQICKSISRDMSTNQYCIIQDYIS